jgi:protein-disulfide isomerase
VLVVAAGFVINSVRDDSGDVAAAATAASSDYSLVVGPDDAPHRVVVYEDFLCPYCGELEKQTHADLEKLAGEGKVQVEYRPFELLSAAGPYSKDTLEAFGSVLTQGGDTAGDTALKLHDALYADQPSESGPFPGTDDIAATMTKAGADEATVQYFKDGKGADFADAATKAAEAAGVKSTPTIVLDGQAFQDGRTIDDLAANLVKAVS